MEKGVLYKVVPRDTSEVPVAEIKDGFWYENNTSQPGGRVAEDGSIEIMGMQGRIIENTLVRCDGAVFDIVPA